MRLLGFFLVTFYLTGCSTTIVYVVRHAEKVDETDSTDLSPAGRIRATVLADTLANRGIDSIFTTPYRRTRQTAEPLATRLGIRSVDYSAGATGVMVNRIRQIRGKNVLVVGHSNTILDIVKGLGARPKLTKIESGDFDNLYRVQINRWPFGKFIRLLETNYGRATLP